MPSQKKTLNGKSRETSKRNIDWLRILLALLIASFMFTFGILGGFFARGVLEGSVIRIQETTKNELLNVETISLLDEHYPCNLQILDTTTKKLNYLGDLITVLEEKKGKNNADVLELKKLYSILETRHMLLLMNREKACNQQYNIFIFFYSNDKDCKNDVDNLAFILTYLRNKHDDVRVYSFDLNLNSDLINVLEEEYSMGGCSGLVLNKKKINLEIKNSDQLEKLLK